MGISQKQPIVFQQLAASVAKNRLTHAYLFEGEQGTGKKEMALWLSQRIFCLETSDQPCGSCHNCQRISNEEHPDVINILPDGQRIKVDQIREIKETFVKSGMESQQKVLIIHDAEKMTASAANSLLKFIEEPEGKIVIVFLTSAKGRILPTIQSRCQALHFLPLSEKNLKSELLSQGISEIDGDLLAQLTHSLDKAIEIYQEEWFNESKETVDKWLVYILENNSFSFVYVQQKIIKVFKEKEQQGLLFDMLLVYLRGVLSLTIKGQKSQQFPTKWSRQKLLKGIEETLNCRKKIEANVSFQNVCEQFTLHLLEG